MKSLSRKMVIICILLGLIPDLAISYLAMKLIHEGGKTLWLIFLGIQLIHILRGVYDSIGKWIIFYVWEKSHTAEAIYSDMVRNKFPNPRQYPNSYVANDYFESVALAPEIPVDTRLMAKEISTTIKIALGEGGMQAVFRWDKIVNVALKKYAELHF
jgi:hypothetical protein